MSEGPEVRIVADKIAAALLSNEIRIENILHNKIGDEFKSKIIGSSVENVRTFGKNIVIKFSSNVYLRNHMMMWGKWRIYEREKYDNGSARPPLRRPTRQNHSLIHEKIKRESKNNNQIEKSKVTDVRKDSRVRLTIITVDKVLIQFNGPILEYSLVDPSTTPPISLLGPDALANNFDKTQVISNLVSASKKDQNLLISKALLDQQIVSGIGNKYKSEILFLCKVHPFKKVTSLSNSELDELVSNISKILNIGYKNNGRTRTAAVSSNHDKITWDTTHWVFRRSGKDCWKCGAKILSEKKTTLRSTFWCPICQGNGV
ncbi:DNA-formamidopyrimidine glycosylase family protein [Candidatus Nitrosocosmicus hydrocola]|jgi:formamidopyrimidine-DNA glycosylase|uniref:DNA-formamidopyrimidine glycosylase family protein n=1 Tax=Candidatus Nitrosocosmicus hydrocola TaxID=1826872 RepID=UPI0011E5B2A2|nr:DNA-formamidopyrimidine glycosylase family protein [Candidatus Nitrosocosmicus hydrocola]